MRVPEYEDRRAAGNVLADLLGAKLRPPCVVVGIPRGGVVIAGVIAERLGCPLSISFARKLTLPESPELAFGAMDEDGQVVVDPFAADYLAARPRDLARARAAVALRIRHQQEQFAAPPIDTFLPHSTVILADDGLATGYTMRAAIAHAQRHGARRIVVAVPCASTSAAAVIRRAVDDFVCPLVDDDFLAVGSYYEHFQPTSDEEVRSELELARAREVHRVS